MHHIECENKTKVKRYIFAALPFTNIRISDIPGGVLAYPYSVPGVKHPTFLTPGNYHCSRRVNSFDLMLSVFKTKNPIIVIIKTYCWRKFDNLIANIYLNITYNHIGLEAI